MLCNSYDNEGKPDSSHGWPCKNEGKYYCGGPHEGLVWCAKHFPVLPNVDAALTLIAKHAYRFDNLLGPRNAEVRQAVMTVLVGAKLPKAKCGFYVLKEELLKLSELDKIKVGCRAVTEDLLDELIAVRKA